LNNSGVNPDSFFLTPTTFEPIQRVNRQNCRQKKYMSAISSVTSTGNPYQTTTQNGYAQIVQDFNDIGSALQSGDVSAAQTALSAFQQNLPGNSQATASQPFGQNSQANTDYQSLASALQSGNLSSAQKAYANLQKDLQSAQTSTKTGHRGHHRHGSGGGSATSLINSLTTISSTNPATSSTPSATPANSAAASTAASLTEANGGGNDGRLLNALA